MMTAIILAQDNGARPRPLAAVAGKRVGLRYGPDPARRRTQLRAKLVGEFAKSGGLAIESDIQREMDRFFSSSAPWAALRDGTNPRRKREASVANPAAPKANEKE
jgi:hypothetical protein